jgi:hypothetical protein
MVPLKGMKMKIDLSGVANLAPLDDGVYNATLLEGAVKTAKSSGQPYVAITFTVTDEGFEGRKLFRNYSLQPQALWAFKQFLLTMGVDEDVISGEFEIDEVINDLKGAPCKLDVVQKSYRDRMQNEVVKVDAASDFDF